MKIFKIKMIKTIEGRTGVLGKNTYEDGMLNTRWCLDKDQEYYAIDAGDYWLVQDGEGEPFGQVIPKYVKENIPEMPPTEVLRTTVTIIPALTRIDNHCQMPGDKKVTCVPDKVYKEPDTNPDTNSVLPS